MADSRDILKRWRCRQWRADLVDVAAGKLDARRQQALDRHLAACAECAAALAALREVPEHLRAEEVPSRDDAFWLRQRRSIMRTIRQQPAPARRRLLGTDFGWRAALLAAAGVVIAVAGYRALQQPARPRVQVAANIDDLDAQTVVALADEAQAFLPSADLTPGGSWWGDEMLDAAAGAEPGQKKEEPGPLEDFSDEELEALNGLVGAMPG